MTDDFFALNKLKQMSPLGRPLDTKAAPVAKELGKGRKKREKKGREDHPSSEEEEKDEKEDSARGQFLDILV